MSIINRIADLERIVFGHDAEGPADPAYCCWLPSEDPPDVPPGVLLALATVRMRNYLLAMDASIPAAH